MKNLETYLEYVTNWIKDEVSKANAKGVVVGLSGGIDSAVVSLLAKKAFPNNHICVLMPIGEQKDINYAREHAKTHSLNSYEIQLGKVYNELEKELKTKNAVIGNNPLSLYNIKPRLRMTTLYSIAQENGYLVLGTDNLDEYTTGYFTKFGDGGVDLLPIVYLTKSDVWEAGKILGVSQNIIEKEPTAGLFDNQTDEKEMGIKYSELDLYIQKGSTKNEQIDTKIERLIKISNHKRMTAPKPNIYKKYKILKRL